MSKRAQERRESLRDRQLAEAERSRLPAWTTMARAYPVPLSLVERVRRIEAILAAATSAGIALSEQQAQDRLDDALSGEWWQNSRYTVIAWRLDDGEIIHLSIKRNDKEPPGPERWRDFQRIKNDICGEETEAVELYPAESRVVDTANQYHLWVLADPSRRFPFGFDAGAPFRMGPDGSDGLGAKQRAFEEDERAPS